MILIALSLQPINPAAAQPPQNAEGFNGNRAYSYLKEICSFGSRMSGSRGMQQQQDLIEDHFNNLGKQVSYQRFEVPHPESGRPVPLANMIVEWNPEAKERILLCAHYDTRPLPDRDPNPRKRRKGTFIGANDGASGVAFLMELAHHIDRLPQRYGIDLVFFDGEELVYVDDRDDYFLGSTRFAEQYRDSPPSHEYKIGVLFDMIADKKLTLYQEVNSMTWPETRPIVKEIWSTAQRLDVKEFIPRVRHVVRDDHLPLYHIGGIPACDIIDIEYPDPSRRFWHTTSDTPGRCSAASLEKVGRVILAWLSTKK